MQVCVPTERTECEDITVRECKDVPQPQCEDVCQDVYWCKLCNKLSLDEYGAPAAPLATAGL